LEEKEPYFQVPKSLFRSWRTGEINSTTFAVYMLMLDRYKISCLKENRNIKKFRIISTHYRNKRNKSFRCKNWFSRNRS